MNTQQDPEKVQTAISVIEQKLKQIKLTIEDLLLSLDLQDKVSWPDMLDKCASLAQELSQVELLMKKSAIPAGEDNNGLLFKTHLVVPQEITLDINPALQIGTQGRINSWNHEVLPVALRTKLPLEIEDEEKILEIGKFVSQQETVTRQIQAMNKHADALIGHVQDAQRTFDNKQNESDKDNEEMDTIKLVRAIMRGEGIKAKDTSSGSSQSSKRPA